jgi:hypothetical protein
MKGDDLVADKKQKIIPVSFRDTEEDQKMYEIISEHSSKGGFIKDILRDVLIKQKKKDN